MITLVIEASTYHGSAALLHGAALLAERSVAMRGRDHEALMPAVGELLAEQGLTAASIGRVVCGAGPGAFTSLRIAASIAKGIALAANVPLVPVSSLALLVASRHPHKAGRFLAAMDAMRGEHYVQPFDDDGAGGLQALGVPAIVSSVEVDALAARLGATVLGPHRAAEELVTPLARGAAYITNMIDAIEPADLAGWEPAYGRLAEAQVKWEAEHGRPLATG